MNLKTKFPIAISATFLWIGFVCAISFLEAWLKFKAPGITIPLGLGIGRLVFGALNTIEWFFAIAILLNMLHAKNSSISASLTWYLVPAILLVIQSAWLLPALDARAQVYLSGETPPASMLHFYYVGMEVVKVGCLITFGIDLFRRMSL